MIFGIAAEFSSPEAILEAAKEARHAGYTALDAYTPFRVSGLERVCAKAGKQRGTWVPRVVLLFAVLGGLTGFLMQSFAAVISYPLRVAGRPFLSWPAFIPITFELTILFAGLAAGLGVLIGNGLPRLNHPIFSYPTDITGQPRFILVIAAADPLFDRKLTRGFLSRHSPIVHELTEGEST